MFAASLLDVALAVPIGFALGLGVGFVAANRWRISKRNGDEDEERPRHGHDSSTRDYSHDRGWSQQR